MTPVLDNARTAALASNDVKTFRSAAPSNLFLAEGLIETDPGNERLRLNAAMLYFAYAFSFIEDGDPAYASLLYYKGFSHGRAALLKNKKLSSDWDCKVNVYEVSGRLVRTLVDGYETRGDHYVRWYGLNDLGSSVASGVYFCRLQAGDIVSQRRLVLIKCDITNGVSDRVSLLGESKVGLLIIRARGKRRPKGRIAPGRIGLIYDILRRPERVASENSNDLPRNHLRIV